MRQTHCGIELFLRAVTRGAEPGPLSEVRWSRQSKGYECPSALDLAIHLILELYDADSSMEENITRICSNLEMEADQLMHFSRRIGAIR